MIRDRRPCPRRPQVRTAGEESVFLRQRRSSSRYNRKGVN